MEEIAECLSKVLLNEKSVQTIAFSRVRQFAMVFFLVCCDFGLKSVR